MIKFTMTSTALSAALALACVTPAIAQTANGTSTPAGPAATAGTGSMEKGGESGAKGANPSENGPAAGTGESSRNTTATGGNAGGNASKN